MKRRARPVTAWSNPSTLEIEEVLRRGAPSELSVTIRIRPGHVPDVTMTLTVWNPGVVGETTYDVRPGTRGPAPLASLNRRLSGNASTFLSDLQGTPAERKARYVRGPLPLRAPGRRLAPEPRLPVPMANDGRIIEID
jgi:hypothetical protein